MLLLSYWTIIRDQEWHKTSWIFLKGLCCVYAIAFLSLTTQLSGLIGSQGLQPVQELLQDVAAQMGWQRVYLLPTLLWFNSSDYALIFISWGGFALSMFAVVFRLSRPLLILLWIFYLSLTTCGGSFLTFQWDALLLECGFLAIWLIPLGREGKNLAGFRISSPWIILLLRWLLFRLMWTSGLVKLYSGDPSWRDLSALNFHFETQPLPNPIAWYAHQLPDFVLQSATFTMFVIELALPLCFFARSVKLRFLVMLGQLLLQAIIFLTGNYTFFNLLTALLCLLLLNDREWQSLKIWLIGKSRSAKQKQNPLSEVEMKSSFSEVEMKSSLSEVEVPNSKIYYTKYAYPIFAIVILFFSLPSLTRFVPLLSPMTHSINSIYQPLQPFHIVNHYGLFAWMTKERLEVEIQGSRDKIDWQSYTFPYKAGAVDRSLPWVAPHQPRLDWQMWFLPLGSLQGSSWFMNLVIHLLNGTPEVLGLFETNPFTDSPPQFIRVQLYRYHFTDFTTMHSTSLDADHDKSAIDSTQPTKQNSNKKIVWTREFKGEFLPTVYLK